jgi:hypothetical protein
MIIIDDIMSEIELEISRVRRTRNIMNEIQNYSFICQTDKFISIKNRNDESK